MKKFITIIFVFSCLCASAQKDSSKSEFLKKYSYTIVDLSKAATAGIGTCFFIRKERSVYLVTAKHNLYDCDTVHHTAKPRTSSIVFFPGFKSAPVKIPPEVLNWNGVAADTDVVIIRVDTNEFKGVYCVNELIAPSYKRVNNLQIFGQGFGSSGEYPMIGEQHSILLTKEEYELGATGITNVDSFKIFIKPKILVANGALHGFSGSPFFLENRRTKKWRWAGVLTASAPSEGRSGLRNILTTRSEVVLKMLDKVDSGIE